MLESPTGLNDPSLGSIKQIVGKADLVLCMGQKVDFQLGFGNTAQNASWIIVDWDQSILDQAKNNFDPASILSVRADPFEYASELLKETGECYPFGAFLDTIENVHPLEMEVNPKKLPNIGQVMEHLEKYCKTEVAEKRMNGYALCYEVGYTLDADEGEQQAIAIEMQHLSDEVEHNYYLPFSKKGDELELGLLFAVKR